MKRLKDALLLKQLYQLKDLDYQYIDLNLEDNATNDPTSLPDTLPQLNTLMASCHLCSISKVRQNVVVGTGSAQATIVFVGFKPTMVDSSSRNILSGSKGEMLSKIIENVLQIPRESLYITNLIKCYPKNDKTIEASEVYSCLTYLHKELEIIHPKIVVTMGWEAFHYLTQENITLEEVHGTIIQHEKFALMPIYDLTHVLKNPSLKKNLYSDMLKLKEFIGRRKN